MTDTPPPNGGRRRHVPDTDPNPSDILPQSELLGDFAGFDSQGTDLMPLPEGALDDLPPAPASAPSSWIGREPLARDESDVIRGLTQQPPPAGSSNIFDTGPAGSSRFRLSHAGTEHLTGEQPRPSNDVLYADLGSPAEPSSVVFSGDDLFSDPQVADALGRPADSDSGSLPAPSDSDGGGGSTFNRVDSADEGSNLFADPTAADLDMGDDDGDAGIGLGDPASDAELARTGPGSSIFAGSVGPQGSALDVDHIPIMASVDEAPAEDLPFDELPAPPPSGVGNDIFGRAGKPVRPSGVGAVAFDLPLGTPDDEATERSDGGAVDWDLPEAPPSPEHMPLSQKSRRMTSEDAAVLPPAPGLPTTRRAPAQVTGRAPLPEPEAAKKGGLGAWLGGGAVGVLTGAGATAAVAFLGGFVGGDSAPPKPVAAVVSQPDRGADAAGLAAQLEASQKEVEAERKKAADALAAEKGKTRAAAADRDRAQLDVTKARDQATAAERKVLDAVAAGNEAKKDAETAAGKLTAATKSLAESTSRRTAAEAAVAGVVEAVKASKLAAADADPAAVLAKLPETLKAAAVALESSDGKKAAAALAEADARTAAVRTELEAAKKATAAAEQKVATADQRVTEATAAAEKKAAGELEAARGREQAAQRQVAEAKKEADAARAKLEAEFTRQLADARSGVVVPLSTAEQRDRDQARRDLDRGTAAYFAGQFFDAKSALETATLRDPADARGWYFLGLTKWRLADGPGADTAFRKGGELERKGRTVRREVNEALLKVQGVERTVLNGYRP